MRTVWSSLLVVVIGLAPLGAAAQSPAPDAAAFDERLEQIERGDLIVSSPQEVRAALQQLEALRPKDDARRELRLRGFRCDYDDLGTPAQGIAFARAGMADAIRMRDVGGQIRFGLCEANYIDGSGQISQSIGPVEAALKLARGQDDRRLLAQALIHRGSLRSLLGEQAAALKDLLEAQRVLNAAGLKKEAEADLQDIAIAYRRMGDYDRAMDYLRQSIAFAERENYWGALSVALLQTAFLHEDRGEYDAGMTVLRRALQVASEHGLEYDVAAAHLGMASALVSKGEYDAAEISLETARDGFARLGDRSNEAMAYLIRGQILAGRGEHALALTQFDQASRVFASDPNLRYQVDLYASRARSHEALHDYRAAMDDLKLERSGRKRLTDDARTQQSLLLQYQFDTARRDLQNARLQAEQRSQQQRLEAIERANRWQVAALVSGALLMAVLLVLLWRQLRHMRRIRMLALTDALTGVANRRHVETAAEGAVQQARDSGTPLSVLTFDLDWFKQINDCHGHAGGDNVLVRVARACEAALRKDDLLGRIGGEEFVVLLPRTSLEAARVIAERLRVSVERIDLSDIAAELRVTISIGLAMLRHDDDGVHDVIDRADAALYRAKDAGRNRIESEI